MFAKGGSHDRKEELLAKPAKSTVGALRLHSLCKRM